MGKKPFIKLRYVFILCTVLIVGVLVIVGVRTSLGKVDEEIPITDSWLVNVQQIDFQTMNGQVMFRRRVNVDQAGQILEDKGHGLRRVEKTMKDLKVEVLSTSNTVEESQPLSTYDLHGRTIRTGVVFSDRLKLMMICALYLHSMRPQGQA
ncbi:MAG: hypothetical protein AB7T38_01815 [Nitrospirales bacterium]